MHRPSANAATTTMNIILAATLIALTVQLTWGRPQLPPIPPAPSSSSTTTPAATQQQERPILESSGVCLCPDGKPHCSPCAKIGIPTKFIYKAYNGDHKPWYFKYAGPRKSSSGTGGSKNQDGIYHKQTGYITNRGVHIRGKYKYTDKCTGLTFDQLYRADDEGFHPHSYTISDGSVKPPAPLNIWLDDAAPPAEVPGAPDSPILPPEAAEVPEGFMPDMAITTTPATN